MSAEGSVKAGDEVKVRPEFGFGVWIVFGRYAVQFSPW
jgi:hypothetical protein